MIQIFSFFGELIPLTIFNRCTLLLFICKISCFSQTQVKTLLKINDYGHFISTSQCEIPFSSHYEKRDAIQTVHMLVWETGTAVSLMLQAVNVSGNRASFGSSEHFMWIFLLAGVGFQSLISLLRIQKVKSFCTVSPQS